METHFFPPPWSCFFVCMCARAGAELCWILSRRRPLNLLTWPEVAADALIALVNLRAIPELRPSELVAIVSSRPSGWLARWGFALTRDL